jgi:hypothetical protein
MLFLFFMYRYFIKRSKPYWYMLILLMYNLIYKKHCLFNNWTTLPYYCPRSTSRSFVVLFKTPATGRRDSVNIRHEQTDNQYRRL